jgi:hypothetical protein
VPYLPRPPKIGVDVDSRLAFFKNLQVVTNKVHATANIDEIMLELSGEICSLFNADRLTIYSSARTRRRSFRRSRPA